MSGVKDVRVTMSRNERDRLVNNARVAEESVFQANQREQTARNALNAANMKVDELNRTLNSEIAGLNENMRQMAREQNQRLMAQAAEHDRNIRTHAAEHERKLRERSAEHDRKLKEQGDLFNRSLFEVTSKMESQRAVLQRSINDVRQRGEENKRELQSAINSISDKLNAKEQNHRSIANFWVEQTRAYFDDIEKYRHELFTPGQLDKLRNGLSLMLSDFESEAYQSAISAAREVFSNAVELKEEVVSAETEWNYYNSLFQQALASSTSNLSHIQAMQFTFDTEEGEETIDVNIDYWTENALAEIEEDLSKINQRNQDIDSLTKDELIALADTLAQLNNRMEEAVNRAKDALISSQIRAEMAETLVDALSERGWECEGMTYECSEQSEPVHVKLCDGMGNEIVAIITPEKESADLVNQLEINFFDPKSNDEELRRTWILSIQNGLKESGLSVGAPTCREGFEVGPSSNEEIRNIKATAEKSLTSAKPAKR